MLNKEICKKCVKGTRMLFGPTWSDIWYDDTGKCHTADDCWDSLRFVTCPYAITSRDKFGHISVDKMAPENCPHQFAHLVAAGMTDVE